MFYTGVGTRDLHPAVENHLVEIAKDMFSRKLTLRSGGAIGSDSAFARGAKARNPFNSATLLPEIYIPWDGYNNLTMDGGGWTETVISLTGIRPELVERAYETAARIHPKWSRCSDGARKLHTRNVFQVLGMGLNEPSSFLVCWAVYEDSKCTPKGGTRTAWMVAQENGVPCFNLHSRKHRDDFARFVDFFL